MGQNSCKKNIQCDIGAILQVLVILFLSNSVQYLKKQLSWVTLEESWNQFVAYVWNERGKIVKSWIRVAFSPLSFPSSLCGHILPVIREQLVWSSLLQAKNGIVKFLNNLWLHPLTSPDFFLLYLITTQALRHQKHHLLRPPIKCHVMGTASSARRDLVTKRETETEAEMRLQVLSPSHRQPGVY